MKATQGKPHVVTTEKTLDDVASQTTGNPAHGKKLLAANPAISTTGKTRVGNQVVRGETIIIPGAPSPSRLTGKAPDDLSIVVAGLDIPVMSARIIRTMDTATDGWTARIAWNPGEYPAVDAATRPYAYPRAAAYIGNTLIVAGCLYTVEPEMLDSGLTKGLHGYSFTADAVDSHMQPPYEYNNVSLQQLADGLTPMLGIKAVFSDEVIDDASVPFHRVKANERDSIFAFLSKLATQRGILVSCTRAGDLQFHRAKQSAKPVGTLSEGHPLVTGWKASYDGRKRFYAYKCITSGGKTGASTGNHAPSVITSFDTSIPRSRFMTFSADDTIPGNIKNAARWKRNRQFIEALTQEYPVSSWYAPDGSLWDVNTSVTVISPTLGVGNGFTFLIRQVEFILESDRRSAVLSLVPPQAYEEKDIGLVWT